MTSIYCGQKLLQSVWFVHIASWIKTVQITTVSYFRFYSNCLRCAAAESGPVLKIPEQITYLEMFRGTSTAAILVCIVQL